MAVSGHRGRRHFEKARCPHHQPADHHCSRSRHDTLPFVAHVLQSMIDMDQLTTVVSVDGVGAFDLVSRSSMLRGLLVVEGGVRPPVLRGSFMGSCGTTHMIPPMTSPRGRGEQGDPLMPLGSNCPPFTERLFLCFFLTICTSFADRNASWTCTTSSMLNCGTTPRYRSAKGKRRCGTAGGVEPRGIETLQAAAQFRETDAVLSRGNATLPVTEQGMKILGTPLGHPRYVQSFFRATNEAHRVAVSMVDLALLCFNKSKLFVACAATSRHPGFCFRSDEFYAPLQQSGTC